MQLFKNHEIDLRVRVRVYTVYKQGLINEHCSSSPANDTRFSLHEGVQFSLAAEVSHAPGSYVYTMGVLYGEISTWPTKQLVDLSRVNEACTKAFD